MNWLQALILGLVQGLTEFLPVSSSGHLTIGREILGVEAAEDLVFEITVHVATVLATIIVFRKQIWKLLCGLFKFKYNDETDYILKICVSMIPVFIVGMFFKDKVESLFSSLLVVGLALVVTAMLLFFSDVYGGRARASAKWYRNGIGWWQALTVGLGQALAVVPGLSRSGTTISTGLGCGAVPPRSGADGCHKHGLQYPRTIPSFHRIYGAVDILDPGQHRFRHNVERGAAQDI